MCRYIGKISVARRALHVALGKESTDRSAGTLHCLLGVQGSLLFVLRQRDRTGPGCMGFCTVDSENLEYGPVTFNDGVSSSQGFWVGGQS